MKAARPSAKHTSRYITHIGLILIVALLAACTQTPVKPPKPPAPPVETARYLAMTFDTLPGWRKAYSDDKTTIFVRQ